MPRIKPKEVAAAIAAAIPPRSAAQLANDARLSARKGTKKVAKAPASPDFYVKKNLLGPDDAAQPHEHIEISTTGAATAERTLIIDPVNPANMISKAENEKYMNEDVEIMIEPGEDPNAPLYVHAGHQGVPQYIKAGEPQVIKRKFLYSLIAAKVARLVCAFGKDQNGMEFNRLDGPKRTTHRVIVVNDTPRGRADFTRWMAEA